MLSTLSLMNKAMQVNVFYGVTVLTPMSKLMHLRPLNGGNVLNTPSKVSRISNLSNIVDVNRPHKEFVWLKPRTARTGQHRRR